MRYWTYFLAFLVGMSLAAAPAQAQFSDFEDLNDLRRTLEFMGEDYASGYVQPLTDAFGADMNSGLFHNADTDDGFLPLFPINIYVGVTVSGVPTSTLDKTFAPPAQETLSDGTTITFEGDRVPTVFGDTDTPDDASIVVRDPDGSETGYAAPPGLLDASIAPIVMPQVRVGTVFGTDAQLRYFPRSTLSAGGGSYGKVGLFGLAVRHSLNQWIPVPLPLKLAVQGSYTSFSLENDFEVDNRVESEEVVSASGWAVNLHASRSIPVLPFTIYGGVQYEQFDMDYSYAFNPPESDNSVGIDISQTTANKTRVLAGLSFTLAIIRINADYAIGSANNVLTTGIGLRL